MSPPSRGQNVFLKKLDKPVAVAHPNQLMIRERSKLLASIAVIAEPNKSWADLCWPCCCC